MKATFDDECDPNPRTLYVISGPREFQPPWVGYQFKHLLVNTQTNCCTAVLREKLEADRLFTYITEFKN